MRHEVWTAKAQLDGTWKVSIEGTMQYGWPAIMFELDRREAQIVSVAPMGNELLLFLRFG